MKKGFVIGMLTGLTVAGASLVLANSQIQAILNNQIKVTLNGQVQEFKDETTNETQYPITYHDRTYLPLRTVANLVGVDVDYDANSNTAILENDILKEIISKAEESIRYPLMDGKGSVLNAVACKVKSIEIYDIEYMKTVVESYDNKTGIFENIDEYTSEERKNELEMQVNDYKDFLKNYSSNAEKAPIVGNITFVLEYDADAKGAWAGNGPTFISGKYAIGSRGFSYEEGKFITNTSGPFN